MRLRAASVNMLLRSGYHLSTRRPYRAGPEGGEVDPEGVLKLGFWGSFKEILGVIQQL